MNVYTVGKQVQLRELLARKLMGIPKYHLPDLTLEDILNQTPKATRLRNIPPDIQLAYFLAHRALIDQQGRTPLKSSSEQDTQLTRAIFFYRFSPLYQFQRYHDAARWNLHLFLSLVAVPAHTFAELVPGRATSTTFSPAARRFCLTYLDAVLEHHNYPATFEKREEFIRLWKGSRYDFFTIRGSKAKVMKRQVKILKGDWEAELRIAEECMGTEVFEWKVRPYVGVLVPGQREDIRSGVPETSSGDDIINDGRMVKDGKDGSEGLAGNELLKALCADGQPYELNSQREQEDAETVVDLSTALNVLQQSTARAMLTALLKLLPIGEGVNRA
ncbi:hypothetical protein BDV95DRAFT_493914 [Massariosphaeria phaeospora]|uniref:Uncharacterized protein n=1 Tax=Massariosphaeria phaeospora TaxID=100035 RepID=A0A7C8MKB2_9PLEO|nr:hypothetical protein BDV95DRAFT_493914 [Massariosphaeria phaeospora]